MNKKFNLIAIYGPSGCGKDTIKQTVLKNNPKTLFNNVICATTRPKREKEKNGEDYYFMDTETFTENVLNGNMLEAASFNGWFYGTLRSSLSLDKINIGIFNMEAIQTLMEYDELNILPVWIETTDKKRLLRILARENKPDCAEICRRFLADANDYYVLPHSIILNNNIKSNTKRISTALVRYAKNYFGYN